MNNYVTLYPFHSKLYTVTSCYYIKLKKPLLNSATCLNDLLIPQAPLGNINGEVKAYH